MAGKSYVLNADEMNVQTSKANDPFTYATFKRGDKVTGLSDQRVAELVDQGVLVDESAQKKAAESGEPRRPAQSKAPGEKTEEQSPAGSGATPPAGPSGQGVQTPKA